MVWADLPQAERKREKCLTSRQSQRRHPARVVLTHATRRLPSWLIYNVRQDMPRDYNLLAIWGAALSTILAAVKIWEIWRTRRRIEYSYNFAGLAEVGNEIIIRNLSATPIIISYWELVWLKKRRLGLRKQEIRRIAPESDFSDSHVAAHSSYVLRFAEERYFSWSTLSLKGAAIYLRIQIAGERRPRLAKIYG